MPLWAVSNKKTAKNQERYRYSKLKDDIACAVNPPTHREKARREYVSQRRNDPQPAS